MKSEIIGRKEQLTILDEAMASGRPEFIAIYGRRRIGKTFLVKQYFDDQFDFYITGAYNSTRKDMLTYFGMQLERHTGRRCKTPKTWLEAFGMLRDYLSDRMKQTDKVVVFMDELPWLDTPRSGFFSALELFWNGWADSRQALKFIVCGSATTWMTNKLIADKGGLHNRVTRRIYLGPFTLGETDQLLRSHGVKWTQHQIIECYMIFGGTPYYLNKLNKSQSLPQNVDRLFFTDTGELRDEYNILFRSLFNDASVYQRIIEVLAKKARGLTRTELLGQIKGSDGGKFSEALQNLITCDFIRPYTAFGHKRNNTLYQLCDLFTLFYLKHVKSSTHYGDGYWCSCIDSPAHRTWSGYAFEQVCLHHIAQIKAGLGIAAIQATVSAWSLREADGNSWQIDMVIDRRDQVVNLCEMKYSLSAYDITPAYLNHLLERMEAFRTHTGTNKALHLTMITVNGLKPNAQASMVTTSLTAGCLFA